MQQSPSKLSVDQLASIARDVCVYAGRGNFGSASAASSSGPTLLKRLLARMHIARRAPAATR